MFKKNKSGPDIQRMSPAESVEYIRRAQAESMHVGSVVLRDNPDPNIAGNFPIFAVDMSNRHDLRDLLSILRAGDKMSDGARHGMDWQCHATPAGVAVIVVITISDPASLRIVFSFNLVDSFDSHLLTLVMRASGFGVCSESDVQAARLGTSDALMFRMDSHMLEHVRQLFATLGDYLMRGSHGNN